MRTIILLIFLSFTVVNQTNAVVVVTTPVKATSSKSADNEKKIAKEKTHTKHFSFKKLFKRIAHVFEFDLSDPVDGWLSLAIICFGAALALLLISAIVGGIYILGFLATILAIGGFVSFIIWALKAFS
ncbi:MAG TPA: hypothetical protein VK590_03160 [Saprospiraceae bacterium]|nr:hypothetical protein [Saprospiraceae bacterium]